MIKFARPILFALLAALLAAATAAAAAPESFTDLLARPRAAATARLSYGTLPEQFGELFMPEGARAPVPVVVLLHGGCWQAALPGLELMNGIAEDLRRHGFAVWNLEYRRLGDAGGGYPGTFADVALGIDFLRVIARDRKLDLSHVMTVGHSAGGTLALWAAARRRLGAQNPLAKNPLLPRAVVALAGIADLADYRAHGPGACGEPATIERLVARGADFSERDFADTSPAALLPLGVKQLVVSGAEDPIVPARFGDAYAARARAAGDAAETLDLPDAGHFELIDPQAPAWAPIRARLLTLAQEN